MTETLTRYRMSLCGPGEPLGLYLSEEPDAHGEWVRYEDAAAALTAAHAERVAERKWRIDAEASLADVSQRLMLQQREYQELLAHLPGHTCHVSGDTCAGCEYAWERDRRITAALRERDALAAQLAQRDT